MFVVMIGCDAEVNGANAEVYDTRKSRGAAERLVLKLKGEGRSAWIRGDEA